MSKDRGSRSGYLCKRTNERKGKRKHEKREKISGNSLMMRRTAAVLASSDTACSYRLVHSIISGRAAYMGLAGCGQQLQAQTYFGCRAIRASYGLLGVRWESVRCTYGAVIFFFFSFVFMSCTLVELSKFAMQNAHSHTYVMRVYRLYELLPLSHIGYWFAVIYPKSQWSDYLEYFRSKIEINTFWTFFSFFG